MNSTKRVRSQTPGRLTGADSVVPDADLIFCFCRWGEVERDASEAMSLCGTSVKAHYLLGKALLENGKLKEARESLLKSLSLSSSPEFRSYRLSIEEMLYMTRRKLWEADEAVVQANDDNTHM